MEYEPEYLIPPTPWRKIALAFIGTFLSAFLFLFGITMGILTYSPAIKGVVLGSYTDAPAKLPPSPNRIVPFSTPAPETIVEPYPVQIPLNPPYVASEATQDWIRIPSIGVTVPIVQSASLKDEDVLATLNKGAALYPNGVTPGALGNVFISAHSTGEPWKGQYRFAFIRINELQIGDAIHVDWKGARYSYRIVESEIVHPTADFRVVSDRPVPTISLMACWPLWSTKSRMLIHAELTNVTQLTRPAA
jgi:LPXTG-site transpeptidase (sortase) family protein